MELLILLGVFLALLFVGLPVGVALLIPGVLFLIFVETVSLGTLGSIATNSLDSFPLVAIFFFLWAANLLNAGGVSDRIFAFANAVVGYFRGGLGYSNILASIFFSGMSGSAVADAAGLGSVEIHGMTQRGYKKSFSVGITGGSSIIGPIIPPSIPAIILGVTADISVGQLFAAGILPGLLLALCLALMVFFWPRKSDFPRPEPFRIKAIWRTFWSALPGLLTILVILGGIFGGFFTPTEGATVAVVYTILLLAFAYRTFSFRDLIETATRSVVMTASVMFILVGASIFNEALIRQRVASRFAQFALESVENKWLIMLVVLALLVVVGMVLEPNSGIILVTPIVFPILTQLGFDPLHIGIIVLLVLMAGLLTPPVGLVVYTLAEVAGMSFKATQKAVLPFFIPMAVAIVIIAYVPWISTFLPDLFFGR